jgi:hypothetical protein
MARLKIADLKPGTVLVQCKLPGSWDQDPDTYDPGIDERRVTVVGCERTSPDGARYPTYRVTVKPPHSPAYVSTDFNIRLDYVVDGSPAHRLWRSELREEALIDLQLTIGTVKAKVQAWNDFEPNPTTGTGTDQPRN